MEKILRSMEVYALTFARLTLSKWIPNIRKMLLMADGRVCREPQA